MGLQDNGIQIAENLELVTAADARHDRRDLRVGEGCTDVIGPLLRGRIDLAGCGVLHRLKLQVRAQPAQAQVLHVREHPWPRPRRRQDCHLVARPHDGWTNERRTRSHGRHPSHRR